MNLSLNSTTPNTSALCFAPFSISPVFPGKKDWRRSLSSQRYLRYPNQLSSSSRSMKSWTVGMKGSWAYPRFPHTTLAVTLQDRKTQTAIIMATSMSERNQQIPPRETLHDVDIAPLLPLGAKLGFESRSVDFEFQEQRSSSASQRLKLNVAKLTCRQLFQVIVQGGGRRLGIGELQGRGR
ncbi:hypothetical protein NE237_015383 [Protea cynaroides]|uniref:Uncharacterized protein n=1 Tax=Protea cynaroides TaxID=273540 RepID=A0A9Q0QQZ8_9MAGN|nr:hypothetical protein NE237_015383 [Protea cynaroides]